MESIAAEDRADRRLTPRWLARRTREAGRSELSSDRARGDADEVVVDDALHDAGLRDVDSAAGEVAIGGSAMPEPAPGAVLLRPGDARALVRGLVVGERYELTGEQASLVSIQVEGSALDGFDSHRMAVEQIQELLELTRLAIEPIQVPHDYCRRGGAFDLLEEVLVAGAGPVLVGGDGFVDELDRARISESVRQLGAVIALLPDGGVLAGPVDGDPEIDQGGVELYESAPVLPGRTAASRPWRASCQARRQGL